MTAAHCCIYKFVEIVVGEHDIKDGSDHGKVIDLTSRDWTIHPKYDDFTVEYDVCIIKTQSDSLLENGKTACLPQKGIKVTISSL